jgi:hypothetical protein
MSRTEVRDGYVRALNELYELNWAMIRQRIASFVATASANDNQVSYEKYGVQIMSKTVRGTVGGAPEARTAPGNAVPSTEKFRSSKGISVALRHPGPRGGDLGSLRSIGGSLRTRRNSGYTARLPTVLWKGPFHTPRSDRRSPARCAPEGGTLFSCRESQSRFSSSSKSARNSDPAVMLSAARKSCAWSNRRNHRCARSPTYLQQAMLERSFIVTDC